MAITSKKWAGYLAMVACLAGCAGNSRSPLEKMIVRDVRRQTLEKADSFLTVAPETVTSARCERSAGGVNDFYSEGDYWWPDPLDPEAPYIQKDGQSNPGNFSAHRHAMVRLSEISATLTSAWLLTGDRRYADKAADHLNAWFVNPETRMNPHMLYAQAIKGRFTGRSIGLIDAYHLVEVAQSVRRLSEKDAILAEQQTRIINWFREFLTWMTTHEYGIKEMNAENNHGTCWVATAAAFAALTGNDSVTELCTSRLKNVLLPAQMEADGSFPREIKRTKPYGYSLFNMDAFANAAFFLSSPGNDLWSFSTPDGKSLSKGMEFIYPYITDKASWPFAKDIYIWEEWPVRQSCLLFAGLSLNNKDYIQTYLSLPACPKHPEVIRNLPVRHPVIWLNFNKAGKP